MLAIFDFISTGGVSEGLAQIIEGLDGVVSIIDDWLDSVEEHNHRLSKGVQPANNHNSKSKIGTKDIKCAGQLSVAVLRLDEDKVRAVTQLLLLPQEELRLMEINKYLAKFTPNLSDYTANGRRHKRVLNGLTCWFPMLTISHMQEMIDD